MGKIKFPTAFLFSLASWEKKRKIRWIQMVFTFKCLLKTLQSIRYELRGCSIDCPLIFNDPSVTCPAKGEAIMEISLLYSPVKEERWLQLRTTPYLAGPKQTNYNELKHCYFHLGCVCAHSAVLRISSAPGMWWIYYTCLELGVHVLDEVVHFYSCI